MSIRDEILDYSTMISFTSATTRERMLIRLFLLCLAAEGKEVKFKSWNQLYKQIRASYNMGIVALNGICEMNLFVIDREKKTVRLPITKDVDREKENSIIP